MKFVKLQVDNSTEFVLKHWYDYSFDWDGADHTIIWPFRSKFEDFTTLLDKKNVKYSIVELDPNDYLS